MTYDNEGQLATWQNAPSNPTSSTSDLYDGEGHRVEQLVTTGAATTTITYIGSIEELSTTAGATTTTTSYAAGGQRIAQATNGAFSYLGSDGLGSAEVALDGSGNAQASVLYDPYGNTRYSSGTMPGSYGYTGQRADAATGLDYYGARYYDAVAGQFTSADRVGDGLNRYTYVHGDPETATDPTGQRYCTSDGSECSGRVGGGTGGSGGCTSNCGGSTIHASRRQKPGSGPVFIHDTMDCPGAGCAFANADRAVVGDGLQIQSGDGVGPAIYSWGTSGNGATAFGYYGASLQALINLVTAFRNWWQGVSSDLDNPGAAAGDLAGAIFGFIAALRGVDDPDAAANTANGVTGAVDWITGHLIGSHIDDLDAAISGLQAVANAGGTAWYVVANWNGQVVPETSQMVGTSAFYVGTGITPPDAVLERVGADMIWPCAYFAPSDFGNSPGVLKSQDSTYTDPCV